MDVPYIDKVQAILQNFISQENFILHFEDKKTVCFSFLRVLQPNHKGRRVFFSMSYFSMNYCYSIT